MNPLFVSIFLFVSASPASAACGRAFFYAGVPGSYSAELKIGDEVFQDELRIPGITHHPGMLSVREYLTGEYEVPGVFTAAVEEGVVNLNGRQGLEDFDLSFRVTAVEKGKSYPVYFEAQGKTYNTCEMKGQAFLDFEKSKVLGSLTLRKLTDDCRCYGK